MKKIIITADGKVTLARLHDGKTVIKSAEAQCHPSDAFNFAIGANLAFDRLMNKLLLDRQGEVAEPAQGEGGG